jgi:type II secretory ATPase GspE/PulE/Tfp pilus assembly ATPase PilB-like protein
MVKIKGETILSFEVSKEELQTRSLSDFSKKISLAETKETATQLRILIGGAIAMNASDIHIEPEEEQARIRIRLDGILHDVAFLPPKTFEQLLSRIKLLSGLKLNIQDRPQDGRFTVRLQGEKTSIEIRTSVVPAEYGESVAIRILNPQNLIGLSQLGLREDLLALFKEEISKPNGMIIVTGPTGSGKTTTLYAFLKTLQNPEIKIITIEDPIEYHLSGIEQTQVSKYYDFASGLKAIVRQDPDVILVGEIRDGETCDIALQAALTGHLVFSTLHTNDAAGTIARLLALGAKPYNIGPALNMVVAQRLARRVCKACVTFAPPTAQEVSLLKKELGNLPQKIKIPQFAGIKIPHVKGCEACNETGYKGRIGIFEAMRIDGEMENLILRLRSIAEIREAATKKGMVTIRQDGLLKVIDGITTIEEVERVTAEKEE